MLSKFSALVFCILLLTGCDNTIYTYKVTVFGPNGSVFEEYTVKDNICRVFRGDDGVSVGDGFKHVASYPPTYHVIVRREEEIEKSE